MGNADSHSSFVSPAKSSCSLRRSSRREEAPSARSWWRSSQGGRTRGRSYQHAAGPPCSSWSYEHGGGTPQGFVRPGGGGGGSPKVLLRRDGGVRVEFTNSRGGVEPQGLAGLPAAAAAPSVGEPSLRTSKGSSLSSDGSWYDSPWGAELPDNVFAFSPARTEEAAAAAASRYDGAFSTRVDVPPAFTFHAAAAGYNTSSSGRTEDSGLGDSLILHSDLSDFSAVFHSTPHAFPTAPAAARQQSAASSSSASSELPDDVFQEEAGPGGGAGQRYASLTLPAAASSRKDFLKSRIRRLSDWTGSLSRKKRKIQEPYGSESGCSSLWSSNPLHAQNQNQNQVPAAHGGSSRSLNQNQNLNLSSDLQRQNVYDSFMQELQTGCSSTDRTELSEEEEEEEQEEEEEEEEDELDGGGALEAASGEPLDVLQEEEQGGVRRAGWLSFKALLSVSRDGKLQLVARRRWKHYWVTLKGCTLLFYDSYGKGGGGGGERALSPRYALLADGGLVQAVPEHPRREHVFCLSNAHGDAFLFQATSQSDLENWVTATHSASAALLARREGTEDTLRLLRRRSRSLLQRIDSDGRTRKMAELQLSVIREHKSRKAVEGQILQWDQNLEQLNLDLFRLRCYLSSLQGGELPNPKSLLAAASRPSKSALGRLGVFSVSSFHALVCSRDEGTLRRRRSLPGGGRRGLPSSLRVLDGQKRRSDSSQIRVSDAARSQRTPAPPAGRPAALQVCDEAAGVFSLNVSRLDAETDFGLAVTGHVDGDGRSRVFVSAVDPLGAPAAGGLASGDEVLAVNGAVLSGLDLDLLQSLFSPQKLQLLLRRDPEAPPHPQTWSDSDVLLPDGVCEDGERPTHDAARVPALYQTFPEGRAAQADAPRNPYGREHAGPPSPAHLSVCQRLRKVIEELLATEKSYVKDLVCLLDLYLTPLQQEAFLSEDEMEALLGSLPELLDFQRVFLQTLEQRVASCPDVGSLQTPAQFKKLLLSLGGSFLCYADHFKHYSGFCANHVKVQKVLERAKTDGAFKHFLDARNPTNQHSASLESYLIKPVQRVLKYPLLLRELVSLTEPGSAEHAHLTEALRAMEEVATHINEMQKIYEDYGSVFEQLAAEHSTQVTEISMGDFLLHSSVRWLNPLPSLGRLRKDPELTLFVFKRAVVLIYRESSKLKKRMTGSRSADHDPFRFRWLIPVSAVQVRPANITGSECVWELVHSRSEVEGRPETVFQLCSSGVETKASVLRALRLLLRERAPAGSLRGARLSAGARSGACRRRPRWRSDGQRAASGETCSEPLLPRRAAAAGKRTRLCSLTGELEAQLQRLNVTEEDGAAAARRGSSLRRAGEAPELLERDFSVQSLTSIINEDCFYDSVLGRQTAAVHTLQG